MHINAPHSQFFWDPVCLLFFFRPPESHQSSIGKEITTEAMLNIVEQKRWRILQLWDARFMAWLSRFDGSFQGFEGCLWFDLDVNCSWIVCLKLLRNIDLRYDMKGGYLKVVTWLQVWDRPPGAIWGCWEQVIHENLWGWTGNSPCQQRVCGFALRFLQRAAEKHSRWIWTHSSQLLKLSPGIQYLKKSSWLGGRWCSFRHAKHFW